MKIKANTDALLLGFILLGGACLRFYDYFHLPYTYDEFSALFRTRFDTFRDLIRLGVVETDTHPAGVQMFMHYWAWLFGEGEEMVKFPFLLAGTGAIFLGYKTAHAWFGSTTGLITASFLAFLQYPITYSQYARPYASGLFLVLLLIWCLHKAFLQPDRWKKWYFAGYVLAGAACAYNHHFSLFFCGMAGITAFIIIPLKRWTSLFLANCLILLLYLPHIGIFFTQLQKGGIESWLSKPDWSFFMDYGSYLLHHSTWMVVLTAGLLIVSFIRFPLTYRTRTRYRIVLLIWILITYLTAYYYSIYRNAVLQYSVLLFTFPFLVMMLFSFAGSLPKIVRMAIVLIFASVSTLTLIFERQHYTIQYQSVLEQTFAETAKAKEKYGNDKVACMTNISPKIQQFYSGTYNLDPGSVITFDSITQCFEMRGKLKELDADFLTLGWVNISNLEILAVAREIFPVLISKRVFKTGDIYLLSRDTTLPDSLRLNDLRTSIRIDSLLIYRNAVSSGFPMLFQDNRLMMPGWLGYTRFYESPLRELVTEQKGYLMFTLEVENPQPDFSSLFICEVSRADSLIYWTARPLSEFTRSSWGRYNIYIGLKIRDLDLDLSTDRIRMYFSNLDEAYFYMNYFKVEVYEGNPFLYSLFEKIPD